MSKGHQFGGSGRGNGSVSLWVVRSSGCRWHIEVPELVGGRGSGASEHDVVIVSDGDGIGVKGNVTSSVAKLAHGKEGGVSEGRDDVHLSGGER